MLTNHYGSITVVQYLHLPHALNQPFILLPNLWVNCFFEIEFVFIHCLFYLYICVARFFAYAAMRSAKKPSEDEKEAAKEIDKLVEGMRN